MENKKYFESTEQRLQRMNNDYEEFIKLDSDQKTNYQLWEDNFSDTWGNLNSFLIEKKYLETNNFEVYKKETVKQKVLKNINEFRTLELLWKTFYKKKHI